MRQLSVRHFRERHPTRALAQCRHASNFRLGGATLARLIAGARSAMRRPHGCRRFMKKQAFHRFYPVTTDSSKPVKVGIAADPTQMFGSIQSSNFLPLRLHRVWRLPGRQISERIESDFKAHFRALCVRGEWFESHLVLPKRDRALEGCRGHERQPTTTRQRSRGLPVRRALTTDSAWRA